MVLSGSVMKHVALDSALLAMENGSYVEVARLLPEDKVCVLGHIVC